MTTRGYLVVLTTANTVNRDLSRTHGRRERGNSKAWVGNPVEQSVNEVDKNQETGGSTFGRRGRRNCGVVGLRPPEGCVGDAGVRGGALVMTSP